MKLTKHDLVAILSALLLLSMDTTDVVLCRASNGQIRLETLPGSCCDPGPADCPWSDLLSTVDQEGAAGTPALSVCDPGCRDVSLHRPVLRGPESPTDWTAPAATVAALLVPSSSVPRKDARLAPAPSKSLARLRTTILQI